MFSYFQINHNEEKLLAFDQIQGEFDRVNERYTKLEAKKNEMKKIIFASRAKRKQGLFFDFFYAIYKFLFKILTGEKFDFGHFSCIHKDLLDKVVNVHDIWSHYSAGIKKSKILKKAHIFFKSHQLS